MGSKDSIRVIVKRPEDKVGKPMHIRPNLKRLQQIVGGYIEHVPLGNGVALICNEEGKIKGLEHNFNITDGFGNLLDTIVGPVVVLGEDGEDFTDIPLTLREWQEYLWRWGN